METIDEVFAFAANTNGSATHLMFMDGTTCSYRRTYTRAARLAGTLVEVGIVPGDRVACLMGNSPALYEFFIACGLAGAIAVPINTLSTRREVGVLFADCEPRGIVAQASLCTVVPDDVLDEKVLICLSCAEADHEPGSPWRDYETVLSGASVLAGPSRSRPENAAVVIYSSGTTGAPKGIVLGHRQLLNNAAMTRKVLGHTPQDRFLTLLPSFHLFGYSFDFLYSGLVGGMMVVLPSFDPVQALDLIEKYQVTVLAGVPLMFVTMFGGDTLAGRDVSSLRLIDVGGGPVPVSLVHRLKETLGIDTVESYGLTEISTVASVQVPGEHSPEGSCGRVLDGIEIRIHDHDGHEVTVGEPGELQFRSDTFMLEYWQQPELTAATLKDGWLHTGDVGRIDTDGNIFILDRIKDMIVTNGYNVFPKEIENVLFTHPEIQAAAVIGVPEEIRGEDIHAYVVPAPGSMPNIDAILDFCRENLASYKVPRKVVVVDELPLTASGKIKRFALRELNQGQ